MTQLRNILTRNAVIVVVGLAMAACTIPGTPEVTTKTEAVAKTAPVPPAPAPKPEPQYVETGPLDRPMEPAAVQATGYVAVPAPVYVTVPAPVYVQQAAPAQTTRRPRPVRLPLPRLKPAQAGGPLSQQMVAAGMRPSEYSSLLAASRVSAAAPVAAPKSNPVELAPMPIEARP